MLPDSDINSASSTSSPTSYNSPIANSTSSSTLALNRDGDMTGRLDSHDQLEIRKKMKEKRRPAKKKKNIKTAKEGASGTRQRRGGGVMPHKPATTNNGKLPVCPDRCRGWGESNRENRKSAACRTMLLLLLTLCDVVGLVGRQGAGSVDKCQVENLVQDQGRQQDARHAGNRNKHL